MISQYLSLVVPVTSPSILHSTLPYPYINTAAAVINAVNVNEADADFKEISEKKIDRIDNRLDGIERLLQSLTTGSDAGCSELHRHSTKSNASTISHSEHAVDAPDSLESGPLDSQGPEFEGDSSLAAHTAVASELFIQEVQENSQSSNPAMQTALSSLHEIVSQVNKYSSSQGATFRNAKALPPGGLSELPMPPMQAVLAALHGRNGLSQLHSSVICCFRSIESFTELCLKVYFTYGNFSQADFIIVNVGLYYIFLECSFINSDDATRNEYRTHARLCQCNLETALSNLSLILPRTYEVVEALLLGAMYASEVSRTSLAWLLNSTAITIGQTLGFHRAPSRSSVTIEGNDNRDYQALLFWMGYTMDKGLALRLGYAPIMSEEDINVSESAIDSVHDSWSDILRAWVVHAKLQGRIYTQLYSAAALALPISQRQSRVPALVAEMRTMIAEALQLAAMTGDLDHSCSTTPENYTIRSITVHSNLVNFLGSLTLVYRAGGDLYAEDCLQSAKEAMEMHIRSLEMLDKNSGVRDMYLHWAILYTPFVPFTVIFCHIIKSPDRSDLNLLQRFVQSLQSACELSDPITKFHAVCDTLFNVALRYIEVKTLHQRRAVEETFDKYLNALGLMPSHEDKSDETMENVISGSEAFGLIDVSDAPADELYQVPGNGEWVALRLIIDHDGWRTAVARRREQGNPAVWGEAETETIVTARLIGMDKALGWLDQRLFPRDLFHPSPETPASAMHGT
ncbi:hypothetical protein FOXB_15689 [Fusarium oxysporum f. sp. conglutinans Fo5176]|uniref:Xylanolytic transcriptional activator regulatory domain-containing protein n=1 Tax=Fusarium oxysporum (strain Fo5176) TaxID=660025 RepID=F9GAK7_FUSOF|nr:hypothetical protein FOXB_15689 [Fusarium oxysporum f. sp. conglutinans Fo5176]